MSVPLAERHFLLHLPDLYHELAHPLLVARDDPVIEPLQGKMLESAKEAMEYFHSTGARKGRWSCSRAGTRSAADVGVLLGQVLDLRVLLRPVCHLHPRTQPSHGRTCI